MSYMATRTLNFFPLDLSKLKTTSLYTAVRLNAWSKELMDLAIVLTCNCSSMIDQKRCWTTVGSLASISLFATQVKTS